MVRLILSEIGIPSFMVGQNVRAFRSECGLAILCSEDNTEKFGVLSHVSVSRENRYPSWDELIAIKERFFGDIDCMMVMPKKKDYVNVHNFTFHIWKCPTDWGIR